MFLRTLNTVFIYGTDTFIVFLFRSETLFKRTTPTHNSCLSLCVSAYIFLFSIDSIGIGAIGYSFIIHTRVFQLCDSSA